MAKISDLLKEERPRERLVALGADALSLAELLAILLTTGTQGKSVLTLSHELLTSFGSLSGLLDASFEELQQIQGIGKAKALQLKATFALVQRAAGSQSKNRISVKSSLDAYNILKGKFHKEKQEVLLVLLRDIKRHVFACEKVAIGTLSNILTHPREIFYPAVRHKAHSLILAHNHPSGDPTPSKADLQLTQQLVASGRVMGIALDDHLIIGSEAYISLYEQRLFGEVRSHY